MKKILLALALVVPSLANAGTLSGVYQTEPGDTGGVLHVEMAACADDGALTCGTILRAYNADGKQDNAYEHLGKPIVWAMADRGSSKWGKGKIWAPDRDKVYDSKMSFSGNVLQVKGCIAFICRTQNWVVVQ